MFCLKKSDVIERDIAMALKAIDGVPIGLTMTPENNAWSVHDEVLTALFDDKWKSGAVVPEAIEHVEIS